MQREKCQNKTQNEENGKLILEIKDYMKTLEFIET